MSRRGLKIRLITFLVLAGVGVVYVAASYLGLVDKVLGRGMNVNVTLPASGGLYVGSEVDDRGVKIGQVSGMRVTRAGVRVTAHLDANTRLPLDSAVRVDNLSAVGEQYLDFEPPSNVGPYAEAGDTFTGDSSDLPQSTSGLLVDLNRFVNSVNRKDLRTVIAELGTMFRGNADDLRMMIASGQRFIHAAAAHEKQTVALLDSGQDVLRTQQQHAGDLLAFAHGLSQVTGTLKTSDPQLRTILQGGSAAVREVRSLEQGISSTLPVFLNNLVLVNQMLTARLPAIEQTLVTFPKVVTYGFLQPNDGFGHLNMQFNYKTHVCTRGYMPSAQWPRPDNTSDLPLYPAKCRDPRAQPGYSGPDPINQRGVNMAPKVGAPTGTAYRVAPYDARTGQGRIGSQGETQSVFGTSSWESMLNGLVTAGD